MECEKLGHPGGAQSKTAAPPRREEPVEVARASDQDASWTPPWGGVLGTSQWEKGRGRPRTRRRDYVSRLAWERLGVPQEELVEVAGKMEVWASLLRLLPPRPDPRRSGR